MAELGCEAAASAAATSSAVDALKTAIGFTKEHILNPFTRRLWAWRDDFGGESAWAVELGKMVAANGTDELWPLLASR